MGEGLYNFPTIMKLLKKMNYSNFISVEDFRGSDENPIEGILEEDLKYLKGIEQMP